MSNGAIARQRSALPVMLEDQSNRVSALMREPLGELAKWLRMLNDPSGAVFRSLL
jgi:hypothetical protein